MSGVSDQVSPRRKEQTCLLLSPPFFLIYFSAHSISISYNEAAQRFSVTYFWSSSKDVQSADSWGAIGKVFCPDRMEGKWYLLKSFLQWTAHDCLTPSSCSYYQGLPWNAEQCQFTSLPSGAALSHSPAVLSWDLQWFRLPFPFTRTCTRAALSLPRPVSDHS